MRQLILLTLAVLMLASCEKETIVSSEVQSMALDADSYEVDMAKRGKAGKVDICHYDEDTDTYKLIRINRNALKAHLAHGDQEVDADGDGYTAIGSCVGSADDCDDTDPNVNPGVEEICDNGIDDDCDGEVDEEDADCKVEPVFPDVWIGGKWSIVLPNKNFVPGTTMEFISPTEMRFFNPALPCDGGLTFMLKDIQNGVYALEWLQLCGGGTKIWYIFPQPNGDVKFGSNNNPNAFFIETFRKN